MWQEHEEWQARVVAKMCERVYETRGNLYAAFTQMDTNGDGTLTVEEFESGIKGGMAPDVLSYAQMKVLLNMVDADADGTVAYGEFVSRFQPQFAKMLRRRYGMNADDRLILQVIESVHAKKLSLAQAFKTMDADGSGKLNEDEFREALKGMDIVPNEEDLAKFMQAIDKDGDNEICYDEFFDAFSVVDIKTFEKKSRMVPQDMEELEQAASEVRKKEFANQAVSIQAKRRTPSTHLP